MRTCQQFVSTILVVCLATLPLRAAGRDLTPTGGQWKQQLDDWGPDAWVKIRLASGKNLQGQVASIEEGGLLFKQKGKTSSQRLDYRQLADMSLARTIYKTPGSADAAEARRVAMALGAGKHVVARLAGGDTLRGYIQAIDQTRFTLLSDAGGGSVLVPFSEARYLEENLTRNAKMWIIIGAAAGTVLLILANVWAAGL